VRLLETLVVPTRSSLLPSVARYESTPTVSTTCSTVRGLTSFPTCRDSPSPSTDGHMLQLRQCKLAFPSVHLLVGVCSSSLVREHKSNPVFSSSERYESMRHVRWCDEVVEDAPWTVDQDFIDKWQIDYIAHDEEPYASAGKEDVYAYAKSIGTLRSFFALVVAV
jgi:cytidyltransferase-like protein